MGRRDGQGFAADVRDFRKVNMPRWCPLLSLLWLTSVLPSAALAQSNDGVVSAGYKTQPYPPSAQRAMYASPPGVATPLASGAGRTIFEELPDDRGWLYDEMPLDRFLKETFRHAYFRTEYLLWDISDPGGNTLSAPTNAPTFAYPPDLVRDPNNLTGPLIPPSIFSQGEDPNAATTNNTVPLFSFNGGAERYRLPPVYQVTNPAIYVEPNVNPPVFNAILPNTEGVFTNENNGIRATFGFVTKAGTFEGSIFSLQKANAKFAPSALQFLDFADIDNSDGDAVLGDGDTDEFLFTHDAIAQAILIDGQVPSVPVLVSPQLLPFTPAGTANDPDFDQPLARGDNLRIIYNPVLDPTTGQLVATTGTVNPVTGTTLVPVYEAQLTTQLWGTEGNYIANSNDPGSPLQLQPMIGFRYLNFQEDLRQRGLYTFSTIDPVSTQTVSTIISRKIDSTTNNNLYGPQIGLRAEIGNKWFTLGAQPKVMLGLNSYKADLQTENILRPDDRDQSIGDNNQTFGVIGDFQGYGRLNVTPCFSLFAAYNLMAVGSVTRPADNIVYNARSILTDPTQTPVSENDLESDFQIDVEYTSLIIQGLSVGGEIRY
jgi:hypothetical protein